jgi:hypothetical protein
VKQVIGLAVLSVIIGVAADFIIAHGEPFDWKVFAKRSLRHALTVFLLGAFLEMFGYVIDVRNAVLQQTSNAFSRAQQAVTDAGATSLFAFVATPRLESARERLQRVAQGEVPLDSADELTKTWLDLFGQVANTVKATNVISPAYWRTSHNMGAKAAAAHKNAMTRGVRISRLYIVDADPQSRDATRVLASQYAEIGVNNRFIDLRHLEQLPDYNDCRTKLAAIDFVIYDESVVLLTTNSAQNEVLSGRLSRNREQHVDVASQCFEQWWTNAADLSLLH